MYHSQSHSQSHSAPPHTHCPSLSLRSVNGWVTLEVIIKALSDNELQVLDAYHEKNPSPIYEEERARLRPNPPIPSHPIPSHLIPCPIPSTLLPPAGRAYRLPGVACPIQR